MNYKEKFNLVSALWVINVILIFAYNIFGLTNIIIKLIIGLAFYFWPVAMIYYGKNGLEVGV
jgi:hypothetical protein